MKTKKIILFGAGGHAQSCIDVIEQEGHFQIAGLVGIEGEVGKEVSGYRVIADESNLFDLRGEAKYALVAVGQILSPELRIKLKEKILQSGFELAKVIAPTAYISPSAKIGAGTIVMHGAILNTGVQVGSNCIINSKALLEHNVQVRDNTHISTGVVLNGNVSVDEGCFVGSGAVLKEGIVIGQRTVIGMGTIVRRDLGPNQIIHGARV
jgi:sugar O-acyltransferase (sialic acid O-acetyltransferase NeuD family)